MVQTNIRGNRVGFAHFFVTDRATFNVCYIAGGLVNGNKGNNHAARLRKEIGICLADINGVMNQKARASL